MVPTKTQTWCVCESGISRWILVYLVSLFCFCCGAHSSLARHLDKCWHLLCRLVSTCLCERQTRRCLLMRWESTTSPMSPLPHHCVCVELLELQCARWIRLTSKWANGAKTQSLFDVLPGYSAVLASRSSLKEEKNFSILSYLRSTGTVQPRCLGVCRCLRFF